jgi:iron complex outermembrane receptor protein
MLNRKNLTSAINYALLTTLGVAATSTVAAQEEATTGGTTDLDRIQVTGSRLKRAQIEGALPVTVISRDDIEISGKTTVADLLQSSTFNSFGSFRPTSGSSAQSVSEVSLRGLGSGRTLILIDGRRAPTAPSTGQSQDLNSLPLAAVERVEILTDGASAIYGADAVGGVVNIITRKDFNGIEASYGIGTAKNTGDTENGSVIFGTSDDRGRMMAGVSWASREIQYMRDIPWLEGEKGPSSNANNFYVPATNPVTGAVTPGKFISAVPGGCTNPGFWMDGATCRYDYMLVAGATAAIDQKAAFARGDYQINEDWSAYLTANVTRVGSFGRFAPTLPDNGIFIPANTVNNPTGQDVVLKHRFAALGTRDTETTTTNYDVNLGFNWQVNDRVALDFGARTAQSQYVEIGRNFVNVPLAAEAIVSGEYNIYDPINTPEDVLAKIRATTSRDSLDKQNQVYAVATIDLFGMSGGTSSMAVGAEHTDETFQDLYDAASEAGLIGGSSGNSSSGKRRQSAVYAEWLLPVTDAFEVDLAARYDKFNDFGNSFVPKVSFRYQPLDNLTLRASYGEGFRAPPLTLMNSEPAFSADTVVDADTAAQFGQPPTSALQINGLRVATADLEAEESKQWSIGAVWDPADWVSMKLDYYNIEITNQISFFSAQEVINRERDGTYLPSNLFSTRDPITNALLEVRAGYANEGFVKTSGLDFNTVTRFDLGGYGSLSNNLQVSWINNYETGGPNSDTTDFIGTTDVPKWRASLVNQWEKGDFSLAWTINAFDQTESYTLELLRDEYGYTCQDLVDFGYDNGGTSSCSGQAFITHDVAASVNTPWGGKVTIGAINVTNKAPRLDRFGFTPPWYNDQLYSGFGRELYFRYTQTW